MYTRQSSRIATRSNEELQEGPNANESIHHKWTKKKKKKKRAWRKTKVDDSGANTDDERDCDFLDGAQQKHVEKDGGWFATLHDEGVDLSDEGCRSVSSICSGPAVQDSSNSGKQRPSQGFCSACWNLYKKAKRAKAAVKNKLLDEGDRWLSWRTC